VATSIAVSANTLAAVTGQQVSFTAVINGTVTNPTFYWYFGDSYYSGLQNPVHAYLAPGTYSVFCVVTGQNGKSIQSNALAIQVVAAPPPPVPGSTGYFGRYFGPQV
jgi:PKD repeat protein